MHSVQNSECSVRDALRYGGACCNGNVGMATSGVVVRRCTVGRVGLR